jgi:predicted MPP superfamily phosphohydrolase
MFPATLVAKAIFEYNKGLHRYQNTYVHVCEGSGTFGPPMRVGTISEMTILNLIPAR